VTVEQNKALVRRVIDEVWSQGRLAAVDELYAADFVSHQHSHAAGPQDVRGLEAVKTFVREFRQAFPDFYDIIEDQVAEGDKVVTRFTSVGTHRGPLMGLAPTHKAGAVVGHLDRPGGGRQNCRGVGELGHDGHAATTRGRLLAIETGLTAAKGVGGRRAHPGRQTPAKEVRGGHTTAGRLMRVCLPSPHAARRAATGVRHDAAMR
jgi:ketosteroid isomerase-like protein